MPTYKVQWRYNSSLGGAWQKGDLVELDPILAEQINRDSPNVLVLVAPAAAPARQEQPHQDRQLKSGANRKDKTQ